MIIIHDISWLVGGVPMQTREGPEEGLLGLLTVGRCRMWFSEDVAWVLS